MKKALLQLILLPLFTMQLLAQKPEDSKIEFQYNQLPLNPLNKAIKGYSSELVLFNEINLAKLKEESIIEHDKKMAEYTQNKANAQEDFDYKITHWDDYINAAKKDHQVALEAYKANLEGMNVLERLAYRETNKPPTFELPRKPTKPEKFYEPKYYAPRELEILDKKEVLLTTYLRIEGYDNIPSGGVKIKATLYPFEAKQPVTETKEEKYYNTNSQSYQTKTLSTVIISAKYPISLEVVDKIRGKVLLNTMINGEYTNFSNSQVNAIAEDLLNANFKTLGTMLNNKFGFANTTRNTVIYTIKSKKFEYPEYQLAFEKAMSFYNTLKYRDQDLSNSMKEAIAIWETAVSQYVPNDNKARIDEDVVRATYYNLVEGYIWLKDYDKANLYLTKLFAFKLRDSEKTEIDAYKAFINDQKERYLANK